MVSAAWLHVTLLVLSGAIMSGLVLYGWRHRGQPGALPFMGLMTAATVWAGGYVLGLLTLDPVGRVFWEKFQWIGIAFVPVFLVLFALEYTGNDEVITKRNVALLVVVPVVTVVVVWTNQYHDLQWAESNVVVVEGIALVEQEFGAWYWVNLVYAYVLTLVAAFFFARLIIYSDYLYLDQSSMLVVGILAPLAANAVSVFMDTPLPGIDFTPYAFAVTGVAFGNAVFRYRLFDLVPATRQVGRKAAISNLDDGVIIVDTNKNVVYLNPRAVDIFGVDAVEALGEPIESVVSPDCIDFGAPDSVGEIELGERTFEIRSSLIEGKRGSDLGYTVIVHDVTVRKRRERKLRRQRDELETLDRINRVIRNVIQALVGASTREEIETEVCSRLEESGLYRGACMADRSEIDLGSVDLEGERSPTDSVVDLDMGEYVSLEGVSGDGAEPVERDEPSDRLPETVLESLPEEPGELKLTSVPIVYQKTVHGALVVFTSRSDGFSDREVEVLDELGEAVGHAFNAVENREMLVTDSVVEIELRIADGESFFANASRRLNCGFSLMGLVPASGGRLLVYQEVTGESPDAVMKFSENHGDVEGVRLVEEDAEHGVLEFTMIGSSVLFPLTDSGVNLKSFRAEDGECRVVLEALPDMDVGGIVDRVQSDFPGTRLVSKKRIDRTIEDVDEFPEEVLQELSGRQREALEAAYFSGYFDWPRGSTAEEVAESMGVSSPTLHQHLRKSLNKLLDELMENR